MNVPNDPEDPERLRPPPRPEPERRGLPWWGWLIIVLLLLPVLFVGIVFATCKMA